MPVKTDFRKDTETNLFDDLKVDVKDLYQRYPIRPWKSVPPAGHPINRFWQSLYRARFIPLTLRFYMWHVLHRTNLDTLWFDRFKTYWNSVLGGRPLWGIHDFYFLRGIYRIKLGASQVPDTDDSTVHLEAWQQPELLYQVFHMVYVESQRNELEILTRVMAVQPHGMRWLEYGCAAAPIATTYFEFFTPRRGMTFSIADMQTISFHYATYKFRHRPNVVPLMLKPETNFQLPSGVSYDTIFCITVFEHLNKPLDTIRAMHQALETGGLLCFDYIKGEGDGLDTLHAVRQRQEVLKFVEEHFRVIHGQLSQEDSMGLTIVQKK